MTEPTDYDAWMEERRLGWSKMTEAERNELLTECANGEFEWWPKLILTDYLGNERDNPYPFLVFDRSDGKLVVADDYETSNDPTAHDQLAVWSAR
jgi:hypothetical protein